MTMLRGLLQLVAVSALVLACGMAASSVHADSQDKVPEAGKPLEKKAAAARAELLSQLHDALAKSASESEARTLSQQIWAIWLSHQNPTINKLMQDVLAARGRSQFDLAIGLLDTIIERQPDYAEAWNQRATIYFMMGNYEKSLEDVAETLKREPRHFGALSGRGMIRLRQGRDALAWQNFEAARKIHPYIAGRHLIPKSVRETRT